MGGAEIKVRRPLCLIALPPHILYNSIVYYYIYNGIPAYISLDSGYR